MPKASDIKKSLTPEQKDFYDKKTLSSTMKVKDWIGFLSAIAVLDKKGDKKIGSLKKLSITCFVAGGIITFFSLFSGFSPGILTGAVIVVIGFISLKTRKKLEKNDVSNYLREFFIPLLHLFKEKAGEKTKLSAQVDFRNPRTSLTPEQTKVMGRDQKSYAPTYIIAKITLEDQVLLAFVVQESIKDQKWTKRNARGKTKFKSKSKLTHLCDIKMTIPKSEYTWGGTMPPELTITDEGDHFIAKSRIKIKKIGDHVLHVKAFIDTVQAIYGQFEPLNPTQQPEQDNRQTDSVEYEEDGIDMIAPYIWYGGYFDRYDYDSFDHTHYEGESFESDGPSAFDS